MSVYTFNEIQCDANENGVDWSVIGVPDNETVLNAIVSAYTCTKQKAQLVLEYECNKSRGRREPPDVCCTGDAIMNGLYSSPPIYRQYARFSSYGLSTTWLYTILCLLRVRTQEMVGLPSDFHSSFRLFTALARINLRTPRKSGEKKRLSLQFFYSPPALTAIVSTDCQMSCGSVVNAIS